MSFPRSIRRFQILSGEIPDNSGRVPPLTALLCPENPQPLRCNTSVTLTAPAVLVILSTMRRNIVKARKPRPTRVRVPNQQKAIFTVGNQKLVGVVHRLSLTGGSALLAKGPIPEGTLGEIVFGTAFGIVKASIEFLHRGADGVPLAQAFAFLTMNAISSQRFKRALEEMDASGSSDCARTQTSVDAAFEALRQSIRELSGMLNLVRQTRSKG